MLSCLQPRQVLSRCCSPLRPCRENCLIHEGTSARHSFIVSIVRAKPSDYTQSANKVGAVGRHSLLEALIDNIMHLIVSRNTPCAILRNSCPGYADLGYAVGDNRAGEHKLRLQFGLQTLNVSYCQYLDNTIHSKVSACRLTA